MQNRLPRLVVAPLRLLVWKQQRVWAAYHDRKDDTTERTATSDNPKRKSTLFEKPAVT